MGTTKVLLDSNIFISALVGDVDYIVSGDPHLLKLVEFNKIKILTANKFLGL